MTKIYLRIIDSEIIHDEVATLEDIDFGDAIALINEIRSIAVENGATSAPNGFTMPNGAKFIFDVR